MILKCLQLTRFFGSSFIPEFINLVQYVDLLDL